MPTEDQLAHRAAWVAALRSDVYRQATKCLFDGQGYCCLGVAAKVAGCEPIGAVLGGACGPALGPIALSFKKLEPDEHHVASSTYWPQETFAAYFGVAPYDAQEMQGELSSANDGGASFKAIADSIEEIFARLDAADEASSES